ncbi:MAG: methionine--tRNA ligase subunit beta [Phycisphaerae bacterium]|nr:methionine--tRNA ligase subunit beta [Phycisphaerae bacterium]
MSEEKPIIQYEDFSKLDLRIAKVLEVSDHPNADKLLVLTIDIGGQTRQTIAGIKGYYSPESLLGKEVVVVANLAPRKMRGMESHGMLLAATVGQDQQQDVVLVGPDKEVPPGSPVS